MLAAALSTVPFASFELLRSARRAILPSARLEVESQLCSSALIESMASDGFTMERAAIVRLREQVRGSARQNRGLGWGVLRQVLDQGVENLPPLLRLEEEIGWLYVSSDDYLDAVSERLLAVARIAVSEHRLRTLTWASNALIRLPEAILRSRGAWVLAQLCSGLGLPYPDLELPEGEFDDETMEIFNRAEWMMPSRSVGYRRDGATLEFGAVSSRLRLAIRVPKTNPIVLWVSSSGVSAAPVRLVNPQEGIRLPTGHSAVTIRCVTGQTTHLPAITGSAVPELQELDHTLDRLEGARIARTQLTADIVSPTKDNSGYVLRLHDEEMLTAFLPRRFAGFRPLTDDFIGDLLTGSVTVIVDKVDRPRQQVIVRRVKMPWSTGNLEVGARVAGQVIARSKGSLWISLNGAAQVPQPAYEPLFGKVLKSSLPRDAAGTHLGLSKRRSMRSFPADIGETLVVEVLFIDRSSRSIGLGLLSLGSDLAWPPAGVQPGQRRRAIVTGKEYYGVSVSILPDEGAPTDPAVRGTILNSELSWLGKWTYSGSAIEYPLEIGDCIDVEVLEINHVLRTVYVSSKRVSRDPNPLAFSRLREGMVVYGILRGQRHRNWEVNLQPYEIIALASPSAFSDMEPKANLQVQATISHVDRVEWRVHLSGVTLRDPS